MTTTPLPRTVSVLVSGAGTALYYATPDVISSRRARGWAKAGIAAVSFAAAVPEFRAAWADARASQEGDADAVTFSSLPVRTRAVLLGSGAAVLALSVRGLVAVERRAFRHGEARAAAGKRLAHTGPALLYGALSSGLWLLPTPSRAE
jgi:hypothetical protein